MRSVITLSRCCLQMWKRLWCWSIVSMQLEVGNLIFYVFYMLSTFCVRKINEFKRNFNYFNYCWQILMHYFFDSTNFKKKLPFFKENKYKIWFSLLVNNYLSFKTFFRCFFEPKFVYFFILFTFCLLFLCLHSWILHN